MLALASLAAGPAAARSSRIAPGLTAWGVSGARELGLLSSQPMKVTLVLSPRDAAGLTQFDSAPHAALSPAQFAVRFGPSTAAVQAIQTWAHANRLTRRHRFGQPAAGHRERKLDRDCQRAANRLSRL